MAKWHEEIDNKTLSIIHRISGMLDLPEVNEYESMDHFLIDVGNRISQSKSLISQALKNLGGS